MIHLSTANTINVKVPSKPKIIGGYIEFSILEHTLVHYFAKEDDLEMLEYYVSQNKIHEGLKQFIQKQYALMIEKQTLINEDIIIWNYELDCQADK